MNIESGWCFISADFSMQAMGRRTTGSVTLMRDAEGREKWHALPDDFKSTPECPHLYVYGSGETIEDAIIDANLTASHALPINQ